MHDQERLQQDGVSRSRPSGHRDELSDSTQRDQALLQLAETLQTVRTPRADRKAQQRGKGGREGGREGEGGKEGAISAET